MAPDSPEKLTCQKSNFQPLKGFDTYSIHGMVENIASTPNVMKTMTLLQVLQNWEIEPYLPCHLAVFPNPREEAPDSRLEAKSDSSSSGTADILCLQREGLTDM